MDQHNRIHSDWSGIQRLGVGFLGGLLLRPHRLGTKGAELKINKMKTDSIKEAINRLEAMRAGKWTAEQDKKTWAELPKGRETGSLYYQHLKNEIQARASEGAI
jgi:hypothetical protein